MPLKKLLFPIRLVKYFSRSLLNESERWQNPSLMLKWKAFARHRILKFVSMHQNPDAMLCHMKAKQGKALHCAFLYLKSMNQC